MQRAKSKVERANKVKLAPAVFPATRSPQRVQRIMRVRDRDTGEMGTVMGRRGHGANTFLKVRWDNRAKATLIKADQLASIKNRRQGQEARAGRKRKFLFKILVNPAAKLNPGLIDAAATLQAAEYLQKELSSASRKKKKKNPRRIPTNEYGLHITKSGRSPQAGLHSKLYRQLYRAENDGKISEAESDRLFELLREAWPMISYNDPRSRERRIAVKKEFDRVLSKKRSNKNPMSLLEVGSHSAVILSGLATAQQMLSKKKKAKARRPTVAAAGKRLAQRRHGSTRGSTHTLRRKVNPPRWKRVRKPFGVTLVSNVIELGPEDSMSTPYGHLGEYSTFKQAYTAARKAHKGSDVIIDDYHSRGRWRFNSTYNKGGFRLAKKPKVLLPPESEAWITEHYGPKGTNYRNPESSRKEAKPAKRVISNPQPAIRNRKNSFPSPALQKLHEDFLGKGNSGKVMNLYTVPGEPLKNAALAPIVKIEMANGSEQKFKLGNAWLGGTQHGSPERGSTRRLRLGLRQPFPIPNGFEPHKIINLGEVKKLWYQTAKPHLYPGLGVIRFHHAMGEEGGRRPELIMQNGCLAFRGGDYEILREGIAN